VKRKRKRKKMNEDNAQNAAPSEVQNRAQNRALDRIKKIVAVEISTVFGTGLVTFAPGTLGSIVAVVISIYTQSCKNFKTITFTLVALFFAVSLPAINYLLQEVSSRTLVCRYEIFARLANYIFLRKKNKREPKLTHKLKIKLNDPQYVVIDEVVGQLIAIFIVSYFTPVNTFVIFLTFAAFRFFDILKPWPIRQIEKRLAEVKKYNGLGVILDDVVAGVIAGIIAGVITVIKKNIQN
jgi:phosphatidylglycerophosphatase A